MSRKKPRRWADQSYLTVNPRSLASNSAMRFSNPSPRSLENGRLLGSAAMRSSVAAATGAVEAFRGSSCAPLRLAKNRSGRTLILLGETKDIQHPPFGCELWQLLHSVHKAQRAGGITDIKIPGD